MIFELSCCQKLVTQTYRWTHRHKRVHNQPPFNGWWQLIIGLFVSFDHSTAIYMVSGGLKRGPGAYYFLHTRWATNSQHTARDTMSNHLKGRKAELCLR